MSSWAYYSTLLKLLIVLVLLMCLLHWAFDPIGPLDLYKGCRRYELGCYNHFCYYNRLYASFVYRLNV
ncbi:hypothetical protein HanIR_Chr16g0832121 [Helianthus annuus]|nr:hypothetical protein HanIR_Chr16g0832121 [Helianthus annuus]